MAMLIGERYKIESDNLNVTLFERAKSKGIKTTWRAIAYFSTPQNALKYLANLGVMETGMNDLAAVVAKQNEICTLINSLKGMSERTESCTGIAK